MSISDKIKHWARAAKVEVRTVYFAARDPRTPALVRLLALLVAAYALSPIDLIPDFIPVLGYLDDLLIVPLGLVLVIKLLPSDVLESSRQKARASMESPRSLVAAFVFIALWLVAFYAFAYWAMHAT